MNLSNKIKFHTFCKILEELSFKEIKKIKKDYISALHSSHFIKTPYIIYLASELTKEKIKSFYVEAKLLENSLKKQEKVRFLIICFETWDKSLNTLALELEIQIISVKTMINSLLKRKKYDEQIAILEKELSSYYKPTFSYNSLKISTDQLIQRLEYEENNAIFFIEGEKGEGKTSFLKYFQMTLAKNYLKNPHQLSYLPLFLDLAKYNKYETFERFLYYEGFVKNEIIPRSTHYQEIFYEFPFIIFVIDNIEVLYQKMSILTFNFLEKIITLIQSSHIKVVLGVPKSFFYFSYKSKNHLKFFYQDFFQKISVQVFSLEPFNLLQIKEQIVDSKLKTVIEKNPFLRSIANVTFILRLIQTLSLKTVESIHNYHNLFKNLLKLWKTKYLTQMGKELILKILSFSFLEKGYFTFDEIPDYLENFIEIEYKNEDFNLELLQEDLMSCPFFKKITKTKIIFLHVDIMFYYIAESIKESIRYKKYDNIKYIENKMIFHLILEIMSFEELFEVLAQFLKKEGDPLEKGHYFKLIYQVLSYEHKKPQGEILLKSLDLKALNLEYLCLIGMKLSHLSLEGSFFNNCDIRYIEGNFVIANQSNFSKSNYSNSEFKETSFHEAIFEKSVGNNVHFIDSDFKSARFFQAQLRDTVFKNCSLLFVSLHGAILVESSFIDCQIINADLSNIDAYKMKVTGSKMIKNKAISVNFAKAHFTSSKIEDIEWILGAFNNIIFKNCTLSNLIFDVNPMKGAQFIDCELTNVSFKGVDLRASSFKGSVLYNTDFDKADLRESDIFTNSQLCVTTKESLKDTIR